jgi:ACR3 family arsenite efflux pump ArsB
VWTVTRAGIDAKAERAMGTRLPKVDRFLPVWIAIAMVAGLLLGRLVPGLGAALSAIQVDGISLPIAIAIATFGATSGQALAGVVGPLIEVPILVGLVYVSLALAPRLFSVLPASVSSRSAVRWPTIPAFYSCACIMRAVPRWPRHS